MNKFKKYLSEHPDIAARFEKTGSVDGKNTAKGEKLADSRVDESPKSRSPHVQESERSSN